MNVVAHAPVGPSPSMNNTRPKDDSSTRISSHRKHPSSSNASSYSLDRQNIKRQRRQAAGNLVTGFFAGGGDGAPEGAAAQQPKTATGEKKPKKKSTAQPRPEIQVQPRGIGPVYEPNNNDVLCGRGGRINAHVGNVRFRDIVVHRKKEYLAPTTKKLEKAHIAADIVRDIRAKNPPGRFLKEEKEGGWWDIGDAKAIKKVGQALREDAPDIRDEAGSDEDQKEGDAKASPPKKAATPAAEKKAPPATAQQPIATVPIATATAVSGRGAKVISQSQRSVGSKESYTPLAVQTITAPPASYQPILPPTNEPPAKAIFPGMRGGRGAKTAAVSGAAAAAMRHSEDSAYPPPPTHDIAFGRSFHVADQARESSMISGMSSGTTGGGGGPAQSALSGMSGISALTDPISALSGTDNNTVSSRPRPTFQQPAARPQTQQQFENNRYQQLQQLRRQWAQGSQRGSQRTLDTADMRSLGGMSMQRSLSWQDGFQHVDTMSWADHSLLGGGINDVNSVMSAQQSFHSYYLRDHPMGGGAPLGPTALTGSGQTGESSMLRAGSSGLGNSLMGSAMPQQYQQNPSPPPMPAPAQLYHGSGSSQGEESSGRTNRMAGGAQQAPSSSASVASMSIASGSLGGSTIMSDLSDQIIALDLAEPRLLGQFEGDDL